ncbi:histidine phosphatase family protein [Paludicola sp. MB14-C6]|uniref:histidine phosphatase family protein n=1 Tax=Paludihabitans sp. MB14-C6 TaxID=3070656 RepID=UPI0027DD1D84|nr:histidine phosphatase family protein [Paludicola sp. MB14-C6]WMJ23924.1 histidine phosphatase family protein [Paludicola sp. MB14-C6]
MRTYKIYLIRHGLTQGNVEGRYIGRTDLSLCEDGINEIKSLLNTSEYPNVGRVYSSPMLRCIETAQLIYPGFTPTLIDNLREYDFGEFENKIITDLMQDEKYMQWMERSLKDGLKGAEKMPEFNQRILSGLEEIIMDMMKSKISDAALITHGGVIMQLLAMCGIPKRKPTEWVVGNGKGYTILVNSSLWSNTKAVEVYTAVPYTNELIEHKAENEDE